MAAADGGSAPTGRDGAAAFGPGAILAAVTPPIGGTRRREGAAWEDGRTRSRTIPGRATVIMLARLGEGRGRRVLDVGAADGFLSERLAASGWRVTALERDARQAAAAGGARHTLVVADLERACRRCPDRSRPSCTGTCSSTWSIRSRVLRGLDRSPRPGRRRDRLGAEHRAPLDAAVAARRALRVRGPRHPRPHAPARTSRGGRCVEMLARRGPRGRVSSPRPRCRSPGGAGALARALARRRPRGSPRRRARKGGLLAYQFVAVCQPEERAAERRRAPRQRDA